MADQYLPQLQANGPVQPNVQASPGAIKGALETWWPLIPLIGLIVIGGQIGALPQFQFQITFLSSDKLDIVRALTPLAVAAIFIERAVEVLISPWRDKDADTKANAVQNATAMSAAPSADPVVQSAIDDLSNYRGETKKVAFLLAFVLSLLASLAGVHALGPFVADKGLDALSPVQRKLFWDYDILLTAVLIPGGADLVHTVFNAFSSVFNKVQNSANS